VHRSHTGDHARPAVADLADTVERLLGHPEQAALARSPITSDTDSDWKQTRVVPHDEELVTRKSKPSRSTRVSLSAGISAR